jgi:putative phosphoribosyl transferase
VIVVRKLGVPVQPELGMGAVGEGGVRIVDREIVRRAGVSERELSTVEQRERAEVVRRSSRLRGDKTPVPLTGRTVIVVDDGMATGSTARAACQVVRAQGATRVVLAVPVGPEDIERRMRADADEIICLYKPVDFFAVGQFYDRFDQTIDREVVELLRRASERAAAVSAENDPADPSRDKE